MESRAPHRNKQSVSIKTGIIGALIFACLLCVVGFGLFWLPGNEGNSIYPTAVVQIIAAPTFTPTPLSTMTPAAQNAGGGTPSSNSEIPIFLGDYVEIVGTQGDGLRLRSKPGLDGEIEFVAYEGEIFKVDDGPQDASGYHWWHLVAPYDETVQGWAVDNYLKVVQNP
jgi:hypothetical protein